MTSGYLEWQRFDHVPTFENTAPQYPQVGWPPNPTQMQYLQACESFWSSLPTEKASTLVLRPLSPTIPNPERTLEPKQTKLTDEDRRKICLEAEQNPSMKQTQIAGLSTTSTDSHLLSPF